MLQSNVSLPQLFESKDPVYQTSLNLDSLKGDMEANKGASIISKAFEFGRRSWHIKIDIDEEKNVSLWVIEGGAIVNKDQAALIGQSIPIRYSSVLTQFEIVDQAFGVHSSLVFFSFAHD